MTNTRQHDTKNRKQKTEDSEPENAPSNFAKLAATLCLAAVNPVRNGKGHGGGEGTRETQLKPGWPAAMSIEDRATEQGNEEVICERKTTRLSRQWSTIWKLVLRFFSCTAAVVSHRCSVLALSQFQGCLPEAGQNKVFVGGEGAGDESARWRAARSKFRERRGKHE